MLFNTLNFAIFLLIVFFLYWFLTGKKLLVQNLILLVSSYSFYACWDWRFLFLLVFSTALDYFTGIKIQQSPSKKIKLAWLWTSILINVGFLGVFKYYNFFVKSFAGAIALFGLNVNPGTLQIILPVGISFYTFHGLSYIIDIYKGEIKAETNFVDYSVFVCFFPLLVAGPIERATHLLPQIKKPRVFDYGKAVDGLRQILWGLFKKVVIADQCANYVNIVFNSPSAYPGGAHLIGAVFFACQIYCDFSGYSDIALGTAKLFGIDLLRNFAYPFFSRSIAEFWRRWHISLSSWFKDYLYIPLGGSKVGTWKKIRNVFIIFLVSGFWHGANWTFIVWGALNALYIMPSILLKTHRDNINIVAEEKALPSVNELGSMLGTFGLTAFAFIFFRSPGIGFAIQYISNIFSGSWHSALSVIKPTSLAGLFLALILFFVIEWFGRKHQYAIAEIGVEWPKILRWGFYYCIITTIFVFAGSNQNFIYFQF